MICYKNGGAESYMCWCKWLVCRCLGFVFGENEKRALKEPFSILLTAMS